MTLRTLSRTALYVSLLTLTLLYLIPVYVIVVTSLKTTAEVNVAHMWWLPHQLDFSGIAAAWQNLSPNLLNSVYIAVPATFLSAIIGSLNGYVLAKWPFRFANVVYGFLLFGMFIPYQSVLIPLLETLKFMGLYNTIPGLVLVHIIYGIPITTLIFRNYYAGLPTELLEAGSIDGCGFWRAFRHILLPLSIPGFVVVSIWQFTNIWNEFLFALTLTNPPNQPVMVALNNLAGSQIIQWNVQMSGALLAALPTLLVYIFLGRFFIRGLLAGSIKG